MLFIKEGSPIINPLTMNPEIIFGICSNLAIVGWLLLAIAPRWKWTFIIVFSGGISLVLAGVYAFLIVTHFGEGEGNFSTLEGVMLLFQNPYAVLAGWIHYLVFDLFIGAWILKNSQQHSINHFLVLPILFLTLMFGPVGLLLYWILRAIKTKKILHENF